MGGPSQELGALFCIRDAGRSRTRTGRCTRPFGPAYWRWNSTASRTASATPCRIPTPRKSYRSPRTSSALWGGAEPNIGAACLELPDLFCFSNVRGQDSNRRRTRPFSRGCALAPMNALAGYHRRAPGARPRPECRTRASQREIPERNRSFRLARLLHAHGCTYGRTAAQSGRLLCVTYLDFYVSAR